MNGIYSEVENICLAESAAFYYKQYQTEDGKASDNQPVVSSDDLSESQHVYKGIGYQEDKADDQERNNEMQKSKSCCEVSYT